MMITIYCRQDTFYIDGDYGVVGKLDVWKDGTDATGPNWYLTNVSNHAQYFTSISFVSTRNSKKFEF